MNRSKLLAGNWKMNGTLQSVGALAAAISEANTSLTCDTVVCPPFVYLAEVKRRLANGVKLGAQNVSMFDSGAYTGDVSAQMLRDCGCEYAIVGHSERRQFFSESDETVMEKAKLALKFGVVPIVCVGESLAERDQGDAWTTVESQMMMVMSGLSDDELASMVWAYEPVWAIGTGRSAAPEQAQEMHALMREALAGRGADAQSILYGGSVKPDNASRLFACDDIDGGLIGGASLNAEAFLEIGRALSDS